MCYLLALVYPVELVSAVFSLGVYCFKGFEVGKFQDDLDWERKGNIACCKIKRNKIVKIKNRANLGFERNHALELFKGVLLGRMDFTPL